MGDLLWEKGLVKDGGNSLVCGIPAHGYFFHSIHRTFLRLSKSEKADEKKYFKLSQTYRNRAFMFGFALIDPEVQDEIAIWKEETKIERNELEHPYGLMDGISGGIAFISDLLRNEASAKTPGYEI